MSPLWLLVPRRTDHDKWTPTGTRAECWEDPGSAEIVLRMNCLMRQLCCPFDRILRSWTEGWVDPNLCKGPRPGTLSNRPEPPEALASQEGAWVNLLDQSGDGQESGRVPRSLGASIDPAQSLSPSLALEAVLGPLPPREPILRGPPGQPTHRRRAPSPGVLQLPDRPRPHFSQLGSCPLASGEAAGGFTRARFHGAERCLSGSIV